jgi:AcrR family transcriptional regulator
MRRTSSYRLSVPSDTASATAITPTRSIASAETRILDAVRTCVERWGHAKVTIDDVAAEARVSRATIYRMFPGGRDVLFESLRVRELEEFFADLQVAVADATSLRELLVRTVVTATRRLRDDAHLALLLAAEPGEVLSQLTSAGVPRIVRFATTFLAPLLDPYLDRAEARVITDVLSRLTISYFLAPSDVVDLGDPASAEAFLAPFIDVLAPSAPASGAPT